MPSSNTTTQSEANKRHHSQISMHPLEARANHNPFENFMNMFHRPQRNDKQQVIAALSFESSSDQPTQPMKLPRHNMTQNTEYDQMLNNKISNETKAAYNPPRQVGRRSNSDELRVRNISPAHSTGSSSVRTEGPDEYANVPTTRASTCTSSTIASSSTSSSTAASAWRTAICPHTSKPYYWNIQTRESKWKKPSELASAEEREAIQSKERKQRDFFTSMEKNIMKRLENSRRVKEEEERAKKSDGRLMLLDNCDGASEEGSLCSLDKYNATNSLEYSASTGTEGILYNGISSNAMNAGIDSSWTQVASNSSPGIGGGNGNGNEDWIAGWITPNSESNFEAQQQKAGSEGQGKEQHQRAASAPGTTRSESPSGASCLSFSSMEGLSVFDQAATSNYRDTLSPVSLDDGSLNTNLSSSTTSIDGVSREERDDKVHPLVSKPRTLKSRLERIKSSGLVIDKPDLVRTISKMEYDLLVGQLNPLLVIESTKTCRPTLDENGLSPRTMAPNHSKLKDRKRSDESPLTPTTMTCDILSSLHLTQSAEGSINVSLLDSSSSDESEGPLLPMDMAPSSPLTPNDDDEEDEQDNLQQTRSSSSPASASVSKPSLTKRNTCGTIYLGSTLSAPDKDALIKCVCGVYRAHLLQAERSTNPTTPSNSKGSLNSANFNATADEDVHAIFQDRRSPGDYRYLDTTSIPSLATITDFYRSIFLRSQMEVDCIIISLIYIERLIKMTDGKLTPQPTNWRSILFSCMVLSSKVWDDLSMWNCDFSKIGPLGVTFSLSRTNELEIALLRALEYKVKVNASEYAKYYFLLRGMLCRSGLASDDLSKLQPLKKRGSGVTTTTANSGGDGGVTSSISKLSLKERSKSYGYAVVKKQGDASGQDTAIEAPPESPSPHRASLEQIVRMG